MTHPQSRPRFRLKRPAQWSILGFRFVPLLLFGLGTYSILYGGFFHRLPVTETREEEYTEAVPVEPDSPPPGMMPGMDSYVPYGAPPMPADDEMPPEEEEMEPPVEFVTKIKTIETTSNELEWDLNILLAFGGLTRNEKGELVRLAVDTSGPALCPT